VAVAQSFKPFLTDAVSNNFKRLENEKLTVLLYAMED
jgi:hypothetical protein